LVPKEDPAALATALREYLVDPGRIALHGRAGRERALAKFSIPAMAAAYREVYRSLDPRR
jgi:glycosyltransferase involved in cell wall biosynthesis